MTRRLRQSSDGFADMHWEKEDLKLYRMELLQNARMIRRLQQISDGFSCTIGARECSSKY